MARGWPQFAFLGASLQKCVRMSDPILEFTVSPLRKSPDDHVDPEWSVAISRPETHTLAYPKLVRVHRHHPNALRPESEIRTRVTSIVRWPARMCRLFAVARPAVISSATMDELKP